MSESLLGLDLRIIFEASETEESVLDHVFFHLDGQLAVFD